MQFHYKKVHGYTQEQMPKIERSVAYTFDAYSGGLNDGIIGMHVTHLSLAMFQLTNCTNPFHR